jgi:hypothetical protein
VVVAGEDSNDRASLRVLLEALCPDMRGRVVEINDSVRLKFATGPRLTERVAVIAAKARARAERERADLACVFIHEDLDSTEGTAGESAHKRVTQAVETSLGQGHYVLVAAEIEAWLLLFPEALRSYTSGWVLPRKYHGRDTGMIDDPKRVMVKEVAKGGRRYVESDAPAVFRKIVENDGLGRAMGTNRTWLRFGDDVTTCCRDHLGPRRKASG